METISYIVAFGFGVALGSFLSYKFRKPTTVNEYNGTVKNKVRGKGNVQNIDQKFEITPSMSNKEIRQTVRDCKRQRSN